MYMRFRPVGIAFERIDVNRSPSPMGRKLLNQTLQPEIQTLRPKVMHFYVDVPTRMLLV